MKRSLLFVSLLFLLVITACSAEPEMVEVTVEVPKVEVPKVEVPEVEVTVEVPKVEVTVEVLVEVPVEVTRLVEVEIEVTRLVENVVTATPTPEPVAPSQSEMEESQASVADAFISDIEDFQDVERVNLVNFAPGRMEVELYTEWASRDYQPDVSWTIITTLADAFADLEPGQRMSLTGSEEFVFALTTYSTNGDFRYQSETNYDTFIQISNRTISYNDWVAAANAGFR